MGSTIVRHRAGVAGQCLVRRAGRTVDDCWQRCSGRCTVESVHSCRGRSTDYGDVRRHWWFVKSALGLFLSRIAIVSRVGRSYVISSQRALLQCLESLVQKIQIGVVVNLEKVISEGTRSRFSTSEKRIEAYPIV